MRADVVVIVTEAPGDALGLEGMYEWRKLYGPRPGNGRPAPQTLEDAVKKNAHLRSELIRMREREDALSLKLGITRTRT